MKRQGVLSATGVLLLALIAMMTLHEWEDRVPDLFADRQSAPFVIAEQVTAQSFSESGRLQYDLRASQLAEMDGEQRTLLSDPDFRLYDPELVWEVSAREAVVTDKGNHIQLLDQVNARHHGDESVLLTTGELVYQPKKELLTTPGPVTLSGRSGETRADAMRAALGEGQLELNGRVTSRYEQLPQ